MTSVVETIWKKDRNIINILEKGDQMNVQLRALNRFGLGAKVGEKANLKNPKSWLKSQLDTSLTKIQNSDLLPLKEIGKILRQSRQFQNAKIRTQQRVGFKKVQEISRMEILAALQQRISSRAPFLERLVSFWSNHLCISSKGKAPILALAGHYERKVIRPHILGHFSDMVLASARHPAMLIYLDNNRSIGPSSRHTKMAKRRNRLRGLNENYARELLELHTVGVDGGYTQKDVEQLALILTGWTVTGLGPSRISSETDLSFIFRSSFHEPGDKTVLGTRYTLAGVKQGQQVIRDLCRKPQTARFLATKLAQHFVADEPPEATIEHLSQIYQKTDGNLLQVSAALINLKDIWNASNHKFKTPQDWLISALRALGVSRVPSNTIELFRQLRHPVWSPPSPKGFGDSIREWADPDGLMNRAELSRSFSRRLNQRHISPKNLLEVMDIDRSDPLHTFLSDSSIDRRERVALGVAGPSFQWR